MRTLILFGLIILTGCESADLGECPTNSDTQQAAGRAVVESDCNGCHASTVEGQARQGAPSGLDFDNLATVRDEAGELYEEVVDGSMPPGAPLPDAKAEDVRVWLACGAK